MWIDLETVILSEIGQREKKKYYILMHICGTWKNWYRWSYLQSRNRDTDVDNKYGYQGGKVGVGWIGRLGLTYIYYWYYA